MINMHFYVKFLQITELFYQTDSKTDFLPFNSTTFFGAATLLGAQDGTVIKQSCIIRYT